MSFKPLLLWLCVRKRAIMKATVDRTEVLRAQQGLGGKTEAKCAN